MTEPARSTAKHLKDRYGITLSQYDTLFDIQGGRCAICHRTPRKQRLHVDHSHSSGEVRGLLCLLCNRALEATVMAHSRRVREDGFTHTCQCPTCQYWEFPPAKLMA